MVIEDYQIVKEAFEDVIGKTYVAKHTRSQRKVLIKILHKALAKDKELVRVFHNCAKLSAKLRSDHFTKTIGHGTEHGKNYLILKHFNLRPLASHLSNHAIFSIFDAPHVVEKVAGALRTLHINGEVHGVLTPQCIFFDQRLERVRIGNFGFEKFVRLLIFNKYAGIAPCLRYFSPEINSGQRHLHRQSDVYSLGVLFYRLLIGIAPWPEAGMEAFFQGRPSGSIVPPSLQRLEVPDVLDKVVLHALERSVDDRCANLSLLIKEIAEAKSTILASFTPTTAYIYENTDPPSPEDSIVDQQTDLPPQTAETHRESPAEDGRYSGKTDDLTPNLESAPGRPEAGADSKPRETGKPLQKESAFDLTTPSNALVGNEPQGSPEDIQSEFPVSAESGSSENTLAAAGKPQNGTELPILPATFADGEQTEFLLEQQGPTVEEAAAVLESEVHDRLTNGASRTAFPLLQSNEFDDSLLNLLRKERKPSSPNGSTNGMKQANTYASRARPAGTAVPRPPANGHFASGQGQPDDDREGGNRAYTEEIATTQTIDISRPTFARFSVWSVLKILLMAIIPVLSIYLLIALTFDIKLSDHLRKMVGNSAFDSNSTASTRPGLTPERQRQTRLSRSSAGQTKLTVNVQHNSTPVVASIYVNGKLIGRTNRRGILAIQQLQVGQVYLFKIQKAGYRVWAKEVVAARAGHSNLIVNLERPER
ncbi:MAG: protein kinase [bacterium]